MDKVFLEDNNRNRKKGIKIVICSELNKEYTFNLYVYGVIPFGHHKIMLETIDDVKKIIKSNEYNRIVKIWKHKITMENTGEKTIKYTDEVEIYAGIFTFLVALWGIGFYKHRQGKWKKIALII